MKVTTTHHKSSVAATIVVLIGFAAAYPHHRIHINGCQSTESGRIASTVSCGQPEDVQSCIAYTGLDASQLQTCLLEAGCRPDEAEAEAAWAAERCQGDSGFLSEEEYVVELREVELRRRDDTTATSSTSTAATSTTASSTSSSTDTSSTADSSSSSSTTSSTASATSSTSSASSTTTSSTSTTSSSTSSSSTSSGTSSSTSSAASSTSTSSSSSGGIQPVGYVVAVLLALFVAGCVGGICYSCCTERSRRNKAARAAEAKEALLQR